MLIKISTVVYRSFPTSNHNAIAAALSFFLLYIVRFLHQTTTCGICFLNPILLYIVRFLHQTTTESTCRIILLCCISFVSYIKPQPTADTLQLIRVVYRSFPTSNHNGSVDREDDMLVVYRSFPTSNHNSCHRYISNSALYIVRFLHQTTTIFLGCLSSYSCISFVSYIKPQLFLISILLLVSCISFVSYIKPQLPYCPLS